MQNFVNAIPPLNFLVCALLLSISIWFIQSKVFDMQTEKEPVQRPARNRVSNYLYSQ